MPATSEKTMPKIEPTVGDSVYVKPSAIEWEPTQFEGYVTVDIPGVGPRLIPYYSTE